MAEPPTGKPRIPAPLVENLLAAAVLAGVGWVALAFFRTGYLPQPFIYDTNDTFMDWFNTAYWAHHPGAYSVWNSIYPPLSFTFLKFTSIGACYRDSPFWARDCDWLSRMFIFGAYALNAWLIWRAFRRNDPRTAPARTVAMVFGLPMLFALERGNLILPCFTAFALAYGRLAKQAWLRWLAVGVTINFKPYLLLASAPYGIRKRWRWLEGCAFATALIYLLTYAVTGSGSPLEIYQDTRMWVQFTGAHVWDEIYNSTSYAPLAAALDLPIPLLQYVDSRIIDLIRAAIPLAIRIGQAAVLLCLAGAWLKPQALSYARKGALVMSLMLTSQSPGGYAEVFVLFLVFFERADAPARAVALGAAYLLCLPADVILMPVRNDIAPSWLGGATVSTTFGLSLGQFVRPGLLLLIEYALAGDSMLALLRAFRAGSSTRDEAPPLASASAA